MTANDEPLSTYRPSYVAGLERQLAEQQAAIAQAVEALEAVEWVPHFDRQGREYKHLARCAWCGSLSAIGHALDCPREAALAALRAGLQNTKGAKQ